MLDAQDICRDMYDLCNRSHVEDGNNIHVGCMQIMYEGMCWAHRNVGTLVDHM